MDEDGCAQGFGRFPQRHEGRIVVGDAVDVIANHRAFESQVAHSSLQLGDCGVDVLHRQGAEAGEAVGVFPHHVGDFLVGLAAGGDRIADAGEGVVADKGRDDVNIHTQRVHVGEPLLGVPAEGGSQRLSQLPEAVYQLSIGVAMPGDAVPGLAAIERVQHTVGHQMSVYVYAAHSSGLSLIQSQQVFDVAAQDGVLLGAGKFGHAPHP